MNKTQRIIFGGPSFEAVRLPTQRERFLAEMESTMPWVELMSLIEPVFSNPESARGRPLELDRLLRVYFLQHWFQLSDAEVREVLYDSLAMRGFACVGLGRETVPTEAAIAWFRQSLHQYGLCNAIAEATERHLQARGLAVVSGAIVDAHLIDTHIDMHTAVRSKHRALRASA